MKNLFSFLLLALLISCSTESNETDVPENNANLTLESDYFERDGKRMISQEIVLRCSGGCSDSPSSSCRLHYNSGSHTSTCTCVDCSMTVEINEKVSGIESKERAIALKQIEASKNYGKQAIDHAKKYDLSIEGFTKIQYSFNKEVDLVTYFFETIDGEEKSVTFQTTYKSNNRFNIGVVKINCDGGCGCRVVYNHNTNKSECSCADCEMTVEDVK